MKNNPLLSLIVPVLPGQEKMLTAILSRLTLNKRLFPDHTFEVIVVDNCTVEGIQDLCSHMREYYPIKYIYLPCASSLSHSYNIGLRVAQGQVVGTIDCDCWISENFIYGMLNPLIDDSNFRITEISERKDKEHVLSEVVKNAPEFINNQYVDGAKYCTNRGCLFESAKSPHPPEILKPQLVHHDAMGLQILSIIEEAEIPRRQEYSRIWATLMDTGLNCSEAEPYPIAPIVTDGDFCEQDKNFCAIDLCDLKHPSNKVDEPEGWEWGKLFEYSFSVINGELRDCAEHEEWVRDNFSFVPEYTKNKPFSDIEQYYKELKNEAN